MNFVGGFVNLLWGNINVESNYLRKYYIVFLR